MSISFACDAVEQEASRISFVCYKLLEGLQTDPILENDLLILALYTGKWTPKFTAAGLFSMNKHMILSLLGTILTYIIFLLQFK